jgi:hypothetical protein
VLDRAADWLGAPVPEEVQARLNRLHPSPTEERVFSRLTAGRRPVARRFRDDLASLSGWRRLRYAFINLFPSPTYMRWRYDIPHPLLVPLYYPYRWWLGLRSALRARAG